jgi:hypothetical protein
MWVVAAVGLLVWLGLETGTLEPAARELAEPSWACVGRRAIRLAQSVATTPRRCGLPLLAASTPSTQSPSSSRRAAKVTVDGSSSGVWKRTP